MAWFGGGPGGSREGPRSPRNPDAWPWGVLPGTPGAPGARANKSKNLHAAQGRWGTTRGSARCHYIRLSFLAVLQFWIVVEHSDPGPKSFGIGLCRLVGVDLGRKSTISERILKSVPCFFSSAEYSKDGDACTPQVGSGPLSFCGVPPLRSHFGSSPWPSRPRRGSPAQCRAPLVAHPENLPPRFRCVGMSNGK